MLFLPCRSHRHFTTEESISTVSLCWLGSPSFRLGVSIEFLYHTLLNTSYVPLRETTGIPLSRHESTDTHTGTCSHTTVKPHTARSISSHEMLPAVMPCCPTLCQYIQQVASPTYHYWSVTEAQGGSLTSHEIHSLAETIIIFFPFRKLLFFSFSERYTSI